MVIESKTSNTNPWRVVETLEVPVGVTTACPGSIAPEIATSEAQNDVVCPSSGVVNGEPFPTILPPVAASYQYISELVTVPAPCAPNVTEPSPHTDPAVVARMSNEVQGTSVVVMASAAPSQPWKLWVT